jgi:hypothetical protein
MDKDKFDEGKVHEQDWEDHLAAGLKGMRSEFRDRLKDFPTKDFNSHMRAARREMLLAFRSVIDKAIERTEEPPEEPKASRIVIE